ncbi:MAG: transferase [Firmicutes bacterium]|nr:transferase [Bacillota bacterium]
MNNNEIALYVNSQIKNIFIYEVDVSPYIEISINRTLTCFSNNRNKYYKDKNFTVFHSGQYSIFLYYLSNTIFLTSKDNLLATKVYYLNKVLHSVDWFYEIELPEYWGVEHPLGSILGRARYGDGFFIFQGCSVGGNNNKYPKIGSNVIMYSNSKVLGDCIIGDNVLIGADTTIKDQNIPTNCIVFGNSPNLTIKEKTEKYMLDRIADFWE